MRLAPSRRSSATGATSSPSAAAALGSLLAYSAVTTTTSSIFWLHAARAFTTSSPALSSSLPKTAAATAAAKPRRQRPPSSPESALLMSPPDEEVVATPVAVAQASNSASKASAGGAVLVDESAVQKTDDKDPPPASTTATTPSSAMAGVFASLRNTWIEQLSSETPENHKRSLLKASLPESLTQEDGNRTRRPVFNGHYVLVRPTPLPNPRLVLYSPSVAMDLLEFTSQQIHSRDFLNWVSGNHQDISASPSRLPSWSTPYALSIMGTRYTSNCPYGTGDGYGDGRAMSIGQVNGGRYELQLKGAGPTPFCRGADGRAVLRSSIREFLASEAMHHLGISTTRALSLVVSETETVNRPWYSGALEVDGLDSSSSFPFQLQQQQRRSRLPSLDDPRLAQYTLDDRKKIIAQLRHQQKDDPNIMVREPAAITCRVAPSFVRVGHLDLFARRAEKASLLQATASSSSSSEAGEEGSTSRWNRSTREWKELEQMVWHACYREFKEQAYDPFFASKDVASAASAMLIHSARRMATMVGHWIRVGFAQGNFNGDNCLVGGRTMDYGPFGFMDEYHPLFAKWTGSGNHFGFLNQPQAGFVNYQVLVESVVPVICAARGIEDPTETLKSFLEPAAQLFQEEADQTFRTKLGFFPDQEVGDDLWESLEPLIRMSRVDWTLFFRQLSYLARQIDDVTSLGGGAIASAGAAPPEGKEEDDVAVWTGSRMLEALEGVGGRDPTANVRNPFYERLNDETRSQFGSWLERWKASLEENGALEGAGDRMVRTNPKFVLREWMLVGAYAPAQQRGDETELHALHSLILDPYGEGSDHEVSKYYRRAPDEALEAGGTAFMS